MADLIGMLQSAAGFGGSGEVQKEAIFTDTAGATWVVPAGVTSVSAVCIGAGGGGSASTSGGMGGGGGDLRYYNNLAVTPGESLTITVGSGGARGSNGTAGGFSSIARSGTTLLEAAGGGGGTISGTGSKNGTSTTIAGDVGGGDGGTCGNGGTTSCGGGGGAGGYSGNGGAGGFPSSNTDGSGGAGGGGGGGGSDDTAGNGGGVTVFGEGPNGQRGLSSSANGSSGGGGSYGDGGVFNDGTSNSSFKKVPYFGAGGGGSDNTTEATAGTSGAVRIVWSADSSFPSDNVGMSRQITPVAQVSVGDNVVNVRVITIPASALEGDLALLINGSRSTSAQSDPSGWTRIVNDNTTATQTIWYKILESGDAGTTVITTNSGVAEQTLEMIVFRKVSGTFSSVSVTGATISYASIVATTQTQNASSATGPFIVVAGMSTPFNYFQLGTGDCFFTGGVAGSGNVEPAGCFCGADSGVERNTFMKFRIYDEAPDDDVVVNFRAVDGQLMSSFILEVN